jgi:hypothetical protein
MGTIAGYVFLSLLAGFGLLAAVALLTREVALARRALLMLGVTLGAGFGLMLPRTSPESSGASRWSATLPRWES